MYTCIDSNQSIVDKFSMNPSQKPNLPNHTEGLLLSPTTRAHTQKSPTIMINKIEKLQKLHEGYIDKRNKTSSEIHTLQEIKQQLEAELRQQQGNQPLEEIISRLNAALIGVKQQADLRKIEQLREIEKLRKEKKMIGDGQNKGEIVEEKFLENIKEGVKKSQKQLEKQEIQINGLEKVKKQLEDQLLNKKNKNAEEGQKRQELLLNISKMEKSILEKQQNLNAIREEEKKELDLTNYQNQLRAAENEKKRLIQQKETIGKKQNDKLNARKKQKKQQEEKYNNLCKKIEDQKLKKEDLQQRVGTLQQDLKKVKEGIKPKYELKNKTEQLMKLNEEKALLSIKISKVKEKIEQETEALKRYVKPQAIASLKRQIALIQQKKLKSQRIVAENAKLVEQVKQLDKISQNLIWGEDLGLIALDSKLKKTTQRLKEANKEYEKLKVQDVSLAKEIKEYTNQYPQIQIKTCQKYSSQNGPLSKKQMPLPNMKKNISNQIIKNGTKVATNILKQSKIEKPEIKEINESHHEKSENKKKKDKKRKIIEEQTQEEVKNQTSETEKLVEKKSKQLEVVPQEKKNISIININREEANEQAIAQKIKEKQGETQIDNQKKNSQKKRKKKSERK